MIRIRDDSGFRKGRLNVEFALTAPRPGTVVHQNAAVRADFVIRLADVRPIQSLYHGLIRTTRGHFVTLERPVVEDVEDRVRGRRYGGRVLRQHTGARAQSDRAEGRFTKLHISSSPGRRTPVPM